MRKNLSKEIKWGFWLTNSENLKSIQIAKNLGGILDRTHITLKFAKI